MKEMARKSLRVEIEYRICFDFVKDKEFIF
jgi:hypothetical protein